ncbi:NADP-dependent L-serine/L-allo-threonine dehydrogenase ydfG [Aspergillus sclerotioniger CBS 115572]|uniref:NADP-dependent L-serine/L-allo-threonine dehydrogenase ydfG n=1 Tax=Aspergillus sclerotioniger CBS 115572 TaxID=1450535 RepID=A0A317XEV8_9EURO|nr:NADP-dependent L-serine/L-allo-threonine dehydrogenase ydfG [Aspergillus sclerotioniger CBS 115572]PWY96227.1 NADP-dependent L-serine/L-allo-threonine dehydrogenase ydfG [Aspergillus sclerotioniger CBS 115572]
MSLKGSNVLITGASMGIGEAIANALAREGANLILFSRSEDKLQTITNTLQKQYPAAKVIYKAVDIQSYEAVEQAVSDSVELLGHIDILVNNAGLALGAPATFSDLKVSDIVTMNSTNINGLMFTTYAVLNASMKPRKAGTILNITSVTGLEVPPFPGEAVYHCNKAAQEAFSNALRNELSETNIRVLVLRPGCVATNFHSLRVGHNKEKYDSFFEGYQPLVSEDIAHSAVFMLQQPVNVSIKALDVVPSAQRSLNVFDRTWNERNA